MEIADEILEVHGVAPERKAEGVTRVIYDNSDGINNRIGGNKELEKTKDILDDLEADAVMINEHRINCIHKDNRNRLSQIFNGGECEIRLVAGQNVHENKCGRVQKSGIGILLYGSLIDQYNFEDSGKYDTGIGRWVSMVLQVADGIRTRIVCGYNPCHSTKEATRSSYQQQRRYFIMI